VLYDREALAELEEDFNPVRASRSASLLRLFVAWTSWGGTGIIYPR